MDNSSAWPRQLSGSRLFSVVDCAPRGGCSIIFRRAAERLHISQPPLTTQLQQLEQEIGAKLLERDSRHVALTAAGNVFFQSCCQLLHDADTAPQAARRTARGETGRLATGFVASLAHGIVPTLL